MQINELDASMASDFSDLAKRKHIGQQIKTLREAAGMTQAQLAEELDFMSNGKPNGSHIGKIEAGYQKANRRFILATERVVLKRLNPNDDSVSALSGNSDSP